MAPFRVPLLTTGRWRFRDFLLPNDNGGFDAPVYKWRHKETGATVTLVPCHLAGHPRYYRDIESLADGADGMMQVGECDPTPTEPQPSHWPETVENPQNTFVPFRWYTPGVPLYGIDIKQGRVVTDWYATFGGNVLPNLRAMQSYEKMTDAMKNHHLKNVVAPVWSTFAPTFMKKLEDDGYEIESEWSTNIIRQEDVATHGACSSSYNVSRSLRVNNFSNDFLPAFGVLLGYLLYAIIRPPQKKEPQQHTPYGAAGAYGQPPPGYNPQYAAYPPQMQQQPGAPVGYPPPGAYPPQQYGYPQQQQQYYAAPPPPPPGGQQWGQPPPQQQQWSAPPPATEERPSVSM